jgi:hypothetical protein
VKSSARIQTVILLAALLAGPVVAAAVLASITLGLLRAIGVAHDVAISAGVAAIALLANVAALGLGFARSDADARARELTIAEEPAAEAIAS